MRELKTFATCCALFLIALISLSAGEHIDCKSPDKMSFLREPPCPSFLCCVSLLLLLQLTQRCLRFAPVLPIWVNLYRFLVVLSCVFEVFHLSVDLSEAKQRCNGLRIELVRFFEQPACLLPFTNIRPITGCIFEALRIIWILLRRQRRNLEPTPIILRILLVLVVQTVLVQFVRNEFVGRLA